MKNYYLLLSLLVLSNLTNAQPTDQYEPVDAREHLFEVKEICADQLDAFEGWVKRTRYCPLYKLGPLYEVVDSNCIIETSTLRDSLITPHLWYEYLIKINASKCSIDARYEDIIFDYHKVDRKSFDLVCDGDHCQVDILVMQRFDGKTNGKRAPYCDFTWKTFIFKVFLKNKKLKGKLVRITAGIPQKCS